MIFSRTARWIFFFCFAAERLRYGKGGEELSSGGGDVDGQDELAEDGLSVSSREGGEGQRGFTKET